MADVDEAAAKPKRGRAGKAKAGNGPTAASVDKTGESGDNASAGAGDNDGDFARRSYTLDEMQRTSLADARHDDEGQEVKTSEDAFWRAAADRLGFNAVTVEEAADFEDSGAFTAFPAEADVPQGTGDLHAQHTTAIERMENMATETQLDTRSMVFDVRDFLLSQIKARPKPWSATSQDEQRDVAAACEHASQELVRKIVEGIAADERTNVRALLVKYDEGDDIKVTLKVKAFSPEETEAAIIGLHRARGKHVLITVASADDYKDGQREPEIDPDQPGLGFEAGTDEHPDDDSDLSGGEEDEGETEQPHVNLKTGMVETPDGDGGVTEREATPEELAAAREASADFTA